MHQPTSCTATPILAHQVCFNILTFPFLITLVIHVACGFLALFLGGKALIATAHKTHRDIGFLYISATRAAVLLGLVLAVWRTAEDGIADSQGFCSPINALFFFLGLGVLDGMWQGMRREGFRDRTVTIVSLAIGALVLYRFGLAVRGADPPSWRRVAPIILVLVPFFLLFEIYLLVAPDGPTLHITAMLTSYAVIAMIAMGHLTENKYFKLGALLGTSPGALLAFSIGVLGVIALWRGKGRRRQGAPPVQCSAQPTEEAPLLSAAAGSSRYSSV
eukprot:Sspe_Gene.17850::Locus_6374_Transcript_1_1_Confidence_1.000_Length_958::g.17850::m.17850